MKKFGTPTGAAPGCASEKLGLLAGGGAAWAGGASTAFEASLVFFDFLTGLSAAAFFVVRCEASTLDLALERLPVVACCCCLPASGSLLGVFCLVGFDADGLEVGCEAAGAAD